MEGTLTEYNVLWPRDVLGSPDTASMDIMVTCSVVNAADTRDTARTSCVSEKTPAPQALLVARNRNAMA